MPANPLTGPRVALVSDWFAPRLGGIESHLNGLGRALGEAGASVCAITTQPGATSTAFPVQALGGPHLPWLDLAVSPRLVRRMRAALVEARPDVVHIHASIVAPACLAGLIAARRLGLPIALTVHSDLAALAPVLRWLGPRLQGVTLSAVSAHIARQIAPLSRTPPLVLPNGFDAGFWMATQDPTPPDGPVRLVSAMRLERKKRPRVLAGLGAALARGSGRPVEIVIAGEGRLRGRLGAPVQTPGWIGREALRRLYRGAHVFVMPSRHESFGIAALEARAAGLPVIGRSGTGLAEFIRDGEDGFLCDSDAAMAEAVLALAEDPDLWRRMAGPRPALARYDWPAVAARHLTVYAEARSGR